MKLLQQTWGMNELGEFAYPTRTLYLNPVPAAGTG